MCRHRRLRRKCNYRMQGRWEPASALRCRETIEALRAVFPGQVSPDRRSRSRRRSPLAGESLPRRWHPNPANGSGAMNAPLVRYDELCRAIAAAKTFDEVRDIRDEMEHVKLYGRRVKNRELIAEATELQARASRRLGQLLDEAEKLGWIGRGRPPKADPENVPTP